MKRKLFPFMLAGQVASIRYDSGYTHNITNVGDSDLVTLIWASSHLTE